jgi:hypothetical protein
VSKELLPPESARRTRHVELALPPGAEYTAGDHLEVRAVRLGGQGSTAGRVGQYGWDRAAVGSAARWGNCQS